MSERERVAEREGERERERERDVIKKKILYRIRLKGFFVD